MQMLLIRGALALYAAATGLAFIYLASKDEKWSLWMLRLLSAGLLLHLASFGLRLHSFWAAPENRYFLPINTFFGALSYLSLATALVFFLVENEHRLGILGAFVLPGTAIGTGAAVFFADPALKPLPAALQSYWMNLHPMALMTAYAAFGNAFGVGVALLIQERQIKSRKPTELCYRLPSLEELDHLNYKIILRAFPVLAAGLAMGIIWAYKAWGPLRHWDEKVTWAFITALIYAAYLYMRLASGLRGRKAVYLSMAGFASIVFTFLGANYLSELHGYLSGRG